jgi:Protein of unknown function (DUF3592)
MFSQRQQFRFCIGFSIVFALVALTLMIAYTHYSQNWSRVAATVKSAAFKKEMKRTGGSTRMVRSVTFTYVGQSKEGEPIEGRNSISDVGNLEMVAGQKIEILYAPDDPQSHMSVQELNSILKFSLMFGFVAIGVGLMALCFRTSK